jgi:hypothetical protein
MLLTELKRFQKPDSDGALFLVSHKYIMCEKQKRIAPSETVPGFSDGVTDIIIFT